MPKAVRKAWPSPHGDRPRVLTHGGCVRRPTPEEGPTLACRRRHGEGTPAPRLQHLDSSTSGAGVIPFATPTPCVKTLLRAHWRHGRVLRHSPAPQVVLTQHLGDGFGLQGHADPDRYRYSSGRLAFGALHHPPAIGPFRDPRMVQATGHGRPPTANPLDWPHTTPHLWVFQPPLVTIGHPGLTGPLGPRHGEFSRPATSWPPTRRRASPNGSR